MGGDLTKAFVEYLRSNRAYLEEAQKAGISSGFLATVMAANIDDYIAEMVEWAARCGELYCPHCHEEEYYNATNVPRDKDNFLCPKCGSTLMSSCCARCGRNIADVEAARVQEGWTYCDKCLPD